MHLLVFDTKNSTNDTLNVKSMIQQEKVANVIETMIM